MDGLKRSANRRGPDGFLLSICAWMGISILGVSRKARYIFEQIAPPGRFPCFPKKRGFLLLDYRVVINEDVETWLLDASDPIHLARY